MHSRNIVKETFCILLQQLNQQELDYWVKAIKNGLVDCPLSHAIIPVAMNLPSLLWGKGTEESSKPKCPDTNGAQCNLYLDYHLHLTINCTRGVFMIIRAIGNMLRSFFESFSHISWNIFSKMSLNPLKIV